jgi:uncharacterized protein
MKTKVIIFLFAFLFVFLFIFLFPFSSGNCLSKNISQKKTASDTLGQDIHFKSGKYNLYGKLWAVKDGKKHPAVVFLVGSGCSSYQSNYKEHFEDWIPEVFLNQGIHVLTFDKRGIGKSEGNWQTADYYDRASDAYQAIQYLKTLKNIDTTAIGVVGHSQGGWITQIVASKYKDVAFAISLVGPATSAKEQMIDERASRFVCEGLSQKDAIKKATRQVNRLYTLSVITPFMGMSRTMVHEYKFKPNQDISQIKCPMLFVYGTTDEMVPNDKNVKQLKAIFSNKIPENIHLQSMEGMNHHLQKRSKCWQGEDEKSAKVCQELRGVIKDWLKKNKLFE